jgi:hypothetical protein
MDQTAAVRLRGHHLVCLNFFAGEGYSPEYVRNLQHVLAGAATGGVLVVTGVDDVCSPCPGLAGTTCEQEDEVRRLDALSLSLLDVAPGDTVVWEDIGDRLPDILEAWYAGACDGCSWLGVCTHAGLCELCESADLEAEAEHP